MFVYPEQKEVNIGGVKIGGQQTTPCVLVGTIFYDGQKITDKQAGALIRRQEELSKETGIPGLLDVFVNEEKDLKPRIDLAAKATEKPFFLDVPEADLRIKGLRYCQEAGLLDRVILNSVNMSMEKEEVAELKKIGVPNVLVLAFNPMGNNLKGRIDILENGAGVVDKGLLDVAKEIGAKRILVDAAATPMHEGAGSSLRCIFVAKSKFGHPTGIGIHNVVSSWSWLKGRERSFCDVSSNCLARLAGADFVLYGPIENAEKVFPVLAMTDVLLGEALEEEGLNPDKTHPYKKL